MLPAWSNSWILWAKSLTRDIYMILYLNPHSARSPLILIHNQIDFEGTFFDYYNGEKFCRAERIFCRIGWVAVHRWDFRLRDLSLKWSIWTQGKYLNTSPKIYSLNRSKRYTISYILTDRYPASRFLFEQRIRENEFTISCKVNYNTLRKTKERKEEESERRIVN